MSETTTTEQVREQVRERYAARHHRDIAEGDGIVATTAAATTAHAAARLPWRSTTHLAAHSVQPQTGDSLPVSAVAASLGCGNPHRRGGAAAG